MIDFILICIASSLGFCIGLWFGLYKNNDDNSKNYHLGYSHGLDGIPKQLNNDWYVIGYNRGADKQ